MIMNYITLQFGSLITNWPASPFGGQHGGFTSPRQISMAQPQGLQMLTVEELSLFLSHRKIAVASEDEVVSCVMAWLSNNIHQLTNEEILQIIYHINWPYVSFDKLLAVFRAFPALRNI